MFKSTKDYEKAMYDVLTTIRDTNKAPVSNDKLDDTDLGDTLNLCYQRGYIEGVFVNKNAFGNYRCDGNPRLTYQGLHFIETFNQ